MEDFVYMLEQMGRTTVSRDGRSWAIREQEALETAAEEATGAGGPVLSPMPGTGPWWRSSRVSRWRRVRSSWPSRR